MKASANALKNLEAAIAKAADTLAKDGLYIEGVTINSRGDPQTTQSFPARYRYTREIQVRLTNRPPDYIINP